MPPDPLENSVTSLRGVGPERAALLERLGLRTVGDLLLHRPHRYEDRRLGGAIRDLRLNEAAATHGKIVAAGTKRYQKSRKSVFEIVVDDGTARLHCRWWNLPFMEKYFAVGDEILVFGKVKSLRPRSIDHPETEILEPGEEPSIHLNRFAPIYPLTEGLPQRWVRSLLWRTVGEFSAQVPEPHPALSERLAGWPTRSEAIRMIHFPGRFEDIEKARSRLALDEFVELQLAMQRRRRNLEMNARALPCLGTNVLIKKFLGALGFKLSDAQKKVLREIRADLHGAHPMRRLLQGDVGSGKTVVAACSALLALESGFDVALMAPTEILAEQLGRVFRTWFDPLKIPVTLHTGSQPGDAGAGGRGPRLYVGTHALLHSGFQPEQLGLVIIDEQHKFGVAQREKLVRKGVYPHLLVMTATPIPRTLGLTVYGDLDISVIDQMPAGRGGIKTFVRSSEKLPKVWEFVRARLAEGRQAYVVYPRVDEPGPDGVKAVTREFDALQKLLSPHRVGLLHGRMPSGEREVVMGAFRKNTIGVLLATSMIEVGLDVPNATLLLVENAERFGLAQLHQLRGRIGRGAHESYCILIASAKTKGAAQRLLTLEQTNDGFRIAEADLLLRGPGELVGSEQSGAPPLRFGDFIRDAALIDQARCLVKETLIRN